MIVQGPRRPEFLKEEILADIFEATAAACPGQIALISGSTRVTYQELDARADLAAHHLIRRGVGPGDIVGLWLQRGVDLLVCQLAIAKTGAAWLPFDADAPAERVAICLQDARAVGLVTDRDGASPGVPVWPVGALQAEVEAPLRRRAETKPDVPAYVIYTSGSTGTPKGVPITQRAICHFLRSENSVLGVCREDRVYQGFSVAFDMSFEEIWISYLVGATLWIAPTCITADPDALPRALADNGVTVLHAVPTLLALFGSDVPGLRLINLGGEACPLALAERWANPGRRVFNSYGPTEATVSASIAELVAGAPVTIGTPLPNYGMVVVDAALQPLPAGETGELCIVGPGVADGYLGRPELTAEKFVATPWPAEGRDGRLYRTGDLARIDLDGRIECLGRADDQVKVRGFRVELGEIETALSRRLVGATAAVVLKPVGEMEQLVAYLSAGSAGSIEIPALRAYLRETLPPYMVPSHFEHIGVIPRLTSGKIDRKALRALPMQVPTAHEASDLPASEAEELLFGALERLFPGLPIRRDSDFFDDLGGHSLLAARLVSALRAHPRFAGMTVREIYAQRRLGAIAVAMERAAMQRGGGERPASIRPSRWARVACGAAQALTLPFMICLHVMNWLAPFFTYHYFTGDPGDSVKMAVLRSLLVFLLTFPLTFAVAVVASRLLLLGMKAGRYPLWGIHYFRWWIADRLQQTSQAYILSSSSLYIAYLRALGARIGKDVAIGSVTVRQPHLLNIGDGASIGTNVNLENVRVEGGELVVGAIAIGREAYVGSYAVMEGDTAIAAYGRLEGLSALARGERIGEREVWNGSPAQRSGEVDPAARPARPGASLARLVAENLFFLCGAALTVTLFFLPIFPTFALIDAMEGEAEITALDAWGTLPAFIHYTLLALPASGVLVFGTVLIAAAIRWLVLPRLNPGSWPVHGWVYCRRWLANQIQVSSLNVLHGIYATIYAPAWYRLLGARVGRDAEISTVMGIVPDMLTLGDESFIADAVMLGDEEVDAGWMSVDRTVIGRRSFVGNGAYIPDGTTLPPDVLIGVQSKAPASGEMRAGQTWVGSPGIAVPSREALSGFPEVLTFRPSPWRRLGRGLVEAARVLLPLSLVISAGYVIVLTAMPAAADEDWLRLLVLLSAMGMIYGIGSFLFVVALKWLLIGRYRPRAEPMWTPFVWISEAVTSIYESIAVPNFLEYLRGTPMLPVMLRLLGVSTGRGVYMDTTDITEFDCVTIGDHTEMNAWSGPQTHLFEDRVMKIGRIRIGADVTLGVRGTVLYDTDIGDGVRLGPLTLVMKGESLPAGSAWRGSPAQAWS